MNKNQISVLYISEDEANRRFVQTALNTLTNRIVFARNPVEASFKISNEKFKVVLIDYKCIKDQHSRFIHTIALNNKDVHLLILAENDQDEASSEYQLANIKFFRIPENPDDLQEIIHPYISNISQDATIRQLSKGETLIRKGEEDKNVFFVLQGSFYVLDELEGQKIVLGSINKGEIVGMMSLLAQTARTANVIAAEDATVSEIPKDTILNSLNKQPFWVKTLFKTLCNRLIETNERLKEISKKN